jgi:hypothetical protein
MGGFPRHGLAAACAGLIWSVAAAEEPGAPRPFPGVEALRVESDLFAGDKPVARSLTLFHEGVAWDFLELPPKAPAGKKADPEADGMRLVEIVLHDPARERVVVIDPVGHRKTEITALQLERLGASLAKWARASDDRLVRWAGGPDFSAGLREEDGRLELAGPRARYAVTHVAASSPETARSYRQFADTAIMLKALLQPGGIPPFPRLAINRRLEEAGAIPAEVTLEIDQRGVAFGSGPTRLRGVHRSHPRLLADDLARIAEAQAHLAAAEAVDLAEFAAEPPAQAAPPRHDADES